MEQWNLHVPLWIPDSLNLNTSYKDLSQFFALCVAPAVTKRAMRADITHTVPSLWTKPAATITPNVLNVILPDGGLFISNERICFRRRRWRRYSAYQTVPVYLFFFGQEVVVKTKTISGGSKFGMKADAAVPQSITWPDHFSQVR